ncbi:MAG TPA: FAD-dependent oxidoreductase [Anaeromyxobacteraceae bacterium]|nr:FAD-dependent oxidoreductase [Anaeromyxobacteraceae bacterium]
MTPATAFQAVKVIEARDETPTVRRVRVERPPGFEFRASQAARLELPGGESHPFSIASGPARPWLDFAARRSASPFKEAFFALAPGDEVRVLGPRGRFFLDPEVPALLVAGGVGITPMRSMLEHVADAGLALPVALVYQNRTPEEIAFRAEIDGIASARPNVAVHHVLTQPPPGWPGRAGRIDEALLAEAAAAEGARWYVAGPPAFVDRAVGAARALAVPPERLLLEVFRGYEE